MAENQDAAARQQDAAAKQQSAADKQLAAASKQTGKQDPPAKSAGQPAQDKSADRPENQQDKVQDTRPDQPAAKQAAGQRDDDGPELGHLVTQVTEGLVPETAGPGRVATDEQGNVVTDEQGNAVSFPQVAVDEALAEKREQDEKKAVAEEKKDS